MQILRNYFEKLKFGLIIICVFEMGIGYKVMVKEVPTPNSLSMRISPP